MFAPAEQRALRLALLDYPAKVFKMPLYLCQPGSGKPEPWRHGVSVYATPFHEEKDDFPPRPLRRLRHGEIILVDDVCVAWDRLWLRLCWPGRRGGFAGYLPLDKPSKAEQQDKDDIDDGEFSSWWRFCFDNFDFVSHAYYLVWLFFAKTIDADSAKALSGKLLRVESIEDRGGTEEADLDDPAREETGSMPSSDPAEASGAALTCLRTGLSFPSSLELKLLQVYDDGITPPVAINPLNTEPVFCRICREGLHEDADDEQPDAEKDEGTNRGDNRPTSSGGLVASRQVSTDDIGEDEDLEDIPLESNIIMRVDPNDPTIALSRPPSESSEKGPVIPHPMYSANPHAMENPLMAPCECAGSMAFVHYLCVEEWRCRSRHPEARNGLNCETCGAAYHLPPPASRPAQVPNAFEDDMMDAMPPHVMQALRQPHIWWQIGATIVRRRWLRPLAPIIMSPVVSLYCRARRMLKKRGVARRRWACSLCRRRARWKCVRCLRSYYCSRQCQNVSWHIVHKHLCYKPSRLAWSTVVYGAATVALFPGILRDPLMYDLGLLLIPLSFVVSGVLAGSFATVLKKSAGYDIRGRLLELTVLISTIWLTLMSWGLVQAFFGQPDACLGMAGTLALTPEAEEASWLLHGTRHILLQPAKWYYLKWDSAVANSWTWIKSMVCTSETTGCFAHVPSLTVDFYMKSEACASDWVLFLYLYIAAVAAYVGSWLYKMRERHVRQQQRDIQNRELRLRRRQLARGAAVNRPHRD